MKGMKLKQKKWKQWNLYTIMAIMAVVAVFLTAAPTATFAAGNTFKFTVGQVFTSSSGPADGAFTYRLRPLGQDNPMPAGSNAETHTFTITGTRDAEIELVGFSRPGVFRYELSQANGVEKPGYTYDKRAYTIEVYMDAEFNSELIVLNTDGTKTAIIEFENGYRASPSDPALMVDPPVRKIVSGAPAANSVFTFELKAGNASWPMPAGSVNGVKTLTIEGSGVKDFGTWIYYNTGVYTYTVYEVNAAERGYTYDTEVYTITDTVTDANGQLVNSRVVRNSANVQVETMAFVNQYSAPSLLPPKTWDEMELGHYATLLALSGAAAIFLIILAKKRKKQNEK